MFSRAVCFQKSGSWCSADLVVTTSASVAGMPVGQKPRMLQGHGDTSCIGAPPSELQHQFGDIDAVCFGPLRRPPPPMSPFHSSNPQNEFPG